MLKRILILGLILLVLISSGCISNSAELAKIDKLTTQLEEKDSQIKELTESKSELEEKINQIESNLSQEQVFFKEYSIALINIHTAIDYLDLAKANLGTVQWYISGEYYYSEAEPMYTSGKEYALDSKELLIKAKKKLKSIQDGAPNTFFKKDVANRIEQIDILILITEDYYSLLDFGNQELYEINYGSESKSLEYYDKSNNLLPELNSNFKKLSDIQNTIDLEWDQDWYPTFQEESGSGETKNL